MAELRDREGGKIVTLSNGMGQSSYEAARDRADKARDKANTSGKASDHAAAASANQKFADAAKVASSKLKDPRDKEEAAHDAKTYGEYATEHGDKGGGGKSGGSGNGGGHHGTGPNGPY